MDLRLALLQGQEFLLLGRDIALQAPSVEELAVCNHADNRVRRPHLATAPVYVEHFEIRDPVAGANKVDQPRDLLLPGAGHVAGHGRADHFLRALQAEKPRVRVVAFGHHHVVQKKLGLLAFRPIDGQLGISVVAHHPLTA